MYSDTTPKSGDTNHVLLFKICQVFNAENSGNFPPQESDSENRLLYKIAKLLNGE